MATSHLARSRGAIWLIVRRNARRNARAWGYYLFHCRPALAG
ncbi:MAG: hypothetical protein ACJ8CR_13735 [Roseiflexaceae bacterium]